MSKSSTEPAFIRPDRLIKRTGRFARLSVALVRRKRFAKGLKQFAVDGIFLRIVFGVPLHAECEARRIRNPDRLDRAVFRDPLDDDALARFEDALTMQRVDADGLATEQSCEGAAGNQTDVMTVGEDDGGVGMNFAVRKPRHPMVYASGQVADFRMQRTAKGDVHLLPAFDGTILDGEAVYLDARGQADFNWTSRVMGSHAPVAVKKQKERDKHISFVAFDIPWFLGSSIMNHSWQERRQILTAIIAEINSDFVSIIDYTDVSLSNHMTYTRKFGEGSMLKQVDAPYKPGRSKNWLKIKKVLTEDVVITGYTKGAGKYQGMIGAITFGQYKNGELCERGKCSGMTDRERTIFSARFHRTPQEIIGHVMSITHNGLLGDGGFRHPQFERLRPTSDKKAEDCTWS